MIVNVRVSPNASKERIEARAEGEFAAAIREQPKTEESNKRVQRLIAGFYNVPLTSVRFLNGARSRWKTLEVVR